jgi:hypothetical protein
LGDGQRIAVPGMADFSGGGPARTYCRDCSHFADKIAIQTGINTIEKTPFGCVIWAQKMAHAAPSARRDIRLCRSCKHFEKPADSSPRCFIIDSAGTSYKLVSMPDDLKGWWRQKQKKVDGRWLKRSGFAVTEPAHTGKDEATEPVSQALTAFPKPSGVSAGRLRSAPPRRDVKPIDKC